MPESEKRALSLALSLSPAFGTRRRRFGRLMLECTMCVTEPVNEIIYLVVGSLCRGMRGYEVGDCVDFRSCRAEPPACAAS